MLRAQMQQDRMGIEYGDAGTLPFGLIFRNSGWCCSPLNVSTATSSNGVCSSSSMSATLSGFGDGWK
jgi:hypothetical protein